MCKCKIRKGATFLIKLKKDLLQVSCLDVSHSERKTSVLFHFEEENGRRFWINDKKFKVKGEIYTEAVDREAIGFKHKHKEEE